ncbi:hypothetical protein GH714_024684 [Hevea brasiliensis]|uniref:Transcription factor MYC/MYB N-terminal domain-containing protein n=1 Tax=Hevea brasiliensis TaxID=3981 RepID=A0A6A6NIS1_HEVBR|nr:hypothetical protein GH714_024684 [Hevea brasiliensis]
MGADGNALAAPTLSAKNDHCLIFSSLDLNIGSSAYHTIARMAAPPSSRLQSMLQAAAQSVQWTYSLFWQICPQQRILVWGDGYYNGAIKTRKTVQPMEVGAEEASLQRSQQLRDLYESLSAGETKQTARRPSAALSPEDLTESEWFYLMCVSFSFPPGTGLPGKAYARLQHVWLTGANESDSKTFSRAILAKVQEDLGFVQRVKSIFTDHHHPISLPPKPALSEHSTSNTDTSSDQQGETGRNTRSVPTQAETVTAEPSELMQLEMSEDIRLGSPDDGSNNMESDFQLISSGKLTGHHQSRADSLRAESAGRWVMVQDPLCSLLSQ